MKKYFKVFGAVIIYLLTYLFMQIIVSSAYIIGDVFFRVMTGKSIVIEEIVYSNIYILTLIAAIITLLLYWSLFRKSECNLWKRCNFKKISVNNSAMALAIGVSISAFSTALVAYLQKYISSYAEVNESIEASAYKVLPMIAIVILLPIFEEILFRGIVVYEMNKVFNIFVVIIIQALLFGIFHGNLLQGIYTCILAIVLATMNYITGSIWSSIIGHMVYNICGTVVMPLLISLTPNLLVFYLIGGAILTVVLLIDLKKKNSELIAV